MGTKQAKYHAGAHLARIPGRAGWFIKWWEPRGTTIVAQYRPSPDDPPLDVRADKHGCIVATKPPGTHPLHRQIEIGDCVTNAGERRTRTPEDLRQALAQYAGQPIGIRARRGKPGTIARLQKAGETREDAAVALGQFLSNRPRAQEGKPPIIAPADYTFAQLADEVTAWAASPQSGYSPGWAVNVRNLLRVQAARWGALRLADITPAMLGKWADARALEISPNTLGNEIKALRAACKLAVQRQYLETDPSAGLKIPKPRAAHPKFLSDEQTALLLESAHEADAQRLVPKPSPKGGGIIAAPIEIMRKWYNADGTFDAARVRFLLLTALRKSQLSSLTWQQYDATRGVIVLESRADHTEKNRRVNVLPLPTEAREIIDGQPHGAPYIFPNLRGGLDGNLHQRFERIAARVLERGGGHITLHTLRHSALTQLLRHTHDLSAVSKFAGHADTKITQRYAWVLDSELQSQVADFHPTKPAGDLGAAPTKSDSQ